MSPSAVDTGLFRPIPLTVEGPRSVDAVRARLADAFEAQEVASVIPAATPGPRLRWITGTVDETGAVDVRAHRWRPSRAVDRSIPLVFRGRLEAGESGGSVLAGRIDAPVHQGLWLVPAVGFILAAVDGVGGNGIAALLWLTATVGLTAILRANQWDARKDAPQLRQALEAIVRG